MTSTSGCVCRVSRIASSPDCTGLEGGLDQPCDVCIWEGKIIASCFDLVTDETKVNTANASHYTEAEKTRFENYLDRQLAKITIPNKDEVFLRSCMLNMYANPLRNKIAAE